MSDLTKAKCVPCEGGVNPLTQMEIDEYLKKVPSWQQNDQSIKKYFKFPNFKDALDFVNQIGKVAENEGHHPDINFGWGYVEVTLSTHAIEGLSRNDFIFAAKIDQL